MMETAVRGFHGYKASPFALLALTFGLAACSSSSPSTTVSKTGPGVQNLTQISSDPYTIAPGQHATEVEPHVLANGSTLVAAFQTGRIAPGGATDIGWATSTDGGTTWSHGFLPGLTTGEGAGPYDAASDPAVAYDAKHGIWMIASLPISSSIQTPAVVVSHSPDGVNWQNPVSVDPAAPASDKNWIVCDSSSTSPYYGNCYVEWDNYLDIDRIYMNTSADGGLTWGTALQTADSATGLGGQPLVQPNGTVVVPILLDSGYIGAFTSTNGGTAWSSIANVALVQSHTDAGGIRSGPLPSAAVDAAGTVWVVWEDCRFRAACASNDLVYSTSSDGVNWSAVARIPIAQTSSTADYFIPGVGIDPATSGSSAHVAIHYYYYPQTNCTAATCQLYVGFISSANGGATWNQPVQLAGPMQLTWLPNSQNGLMVGDYIATAFTNGVPHGVFAVASAISGGTYKEGTFTAPGLTATASGKQLSSLLDRPLHNLSDKIERERPEKGVIPPLRRRARRSAK